MLVFGLPLTHFGEALVKRVAARLEFFLLNERLLHVLFGRNVFGQFGHTQVTVSALQGSSRKTSFQLAVNPACLT